MKMQDCRQCTTMTEHGEREASVCLPCAVQCTTKIECMPLPMRSPMHHEDRMHATSHAQSNAPPRPNAGVEIETTSTREGRGTTHPEPAVRALPPSFQGDAFLLRRLFYTAAKNGHFLLIPHIPQKGSFGSLNLERHLTFRLSSPIGRFFSCFFCRAERFSLFCA